MGPISKDEIELLGDSVEEIRSRDFKFTQAPREHREFDDKFEIFDDFACDSCKQALSGGLLAASHRDNFDKLKDITIISGPFEKEPEVSNKKVLLYGNCTYRYRHLGEYVSGCPPLSGEAASALLNFYREPPKISFCSIALRDDDIREIVDRIASIGYDGIELWGGHIERYEREKGEIGSLKELIDGYGLGVPMISPYFDFPKKYEESVKQAEKFIGYSKVFGGAIVRVFTNNTSSAESIHEDWVSVVKGLKATCQMGIPEGIEFSLETHGGKLHDTTNTTLRLIRKVDMPNLKVNLDIYNLFAIGEDPLDSLEMLYPYVNHLHLKNVRTTGDYEEKCYLSEGDMDYEPFLKRLDEKGYNRFASVEWFGGSPYKAAEVELKYLREFFPVAVEAFH